MPPVTCWYRAAIAVDDQPMICITTRSAVLLRGSASGLTTGSGRASNGA
ncbi:hypothetical protein [Streptomyces sp. AK08-01B]